MTNKNKKAKFIVACGGTGGHTFPGLAVANELRRLGYEVKVWTSGRSIEETVMKSWDGEVFSTGARPLRLRNALAIWLSYLRCKHEIKKYKPNALLAMGSYASFPPVWAARKCHLPIILHEANTIPGKAVSFLSRLADLVAISFEETKKYLPKIETELTGLPVRQEILNQPRFEEVPLSAFCVFVTGGSQGAHAVNEIVPEALRLVQRDRERCNITAPLYVIHQTGKADEKAIKEFYQKHQINARVNAFEHEMGRAFATADLVIARAGASTCFELANVGKPAFFIPLPSALRNHQHFNAQAFVVKGAADEGEQANLNPRILANYILHKMEHPEELVTRTRAMHDMATIDAAHKVATIMTRYV